MFILLKILISLVKNFLLQVKPVMIGLLDGHGSQSSDCYISLLSEEPAISGKPALLIEDLLHFAVSEGIILLKDNMYL